MDRVDWKCMKCGASAGSCDCWRKCVCGHLYYKKDKHCDNPVHHIAREIAADVCTSMQSVYPEQMKSASGGFRKTLRSKIEIQALRSLNALPEND